jgi:hypothetical protein
VKNLKLMLVIICAVVAGCNASEEQNAKLKCKYSRVTTVEKAGTKTTVEECLPDPAEALALLEQEKVKKEKSLQDIEPEHVCVAEINGVTQILPLADCEK